MLAGGGKVLGRASLLKRQCNYQLRPKKLTLGSSTASQGALWRPSPKAREDEKGHVGWKWGIPTLPANCLNWKDGYERQGLSMATEDHRLLFQYL